MKFYQSILTVVALALFTNSVDADVVELFGDTVTDTSAFDTVKDDGGVGLAVVSVQGGAGAEKLSFLDNSGSTNPGTASDDKPEAYYNFTNTTTGLRLDFDVQFNNSALTTLVSDPEIRLRFGNNGTDPTNDGKTGFAMIFRHEDTDSTNHIRAGQWNGTDKVSSTSSGLGGFTSVADNTELSLSIIANNAFVDQAYTAFGGRTVAANTYDLYIDGNFIRNYALGEDTAEFDRDLGFGNIGFLGSSDSDQGVDVWFDNIILSTGADSGLTAVPEPGSMAFLLGGLTLGLLRRRR